MGALREGSELDELLGGNSLDRSLLGGLGGLIGPRGVARGSHGLGGRGNGLGGGGNSRGLGGIGTHGRGGGDKEYGQGHGDGTLREKPVGSTGPLGAEPIILGQMDRAVIDAVIRAHLDQIRYCYQRELQKDPSLVGKVTVRFVIAGDGTVSQSETKASTLANTAVESCIHGRFLRFEFPAPKRNGIVIVTYPFHFAPG